MIMRPATKQALMDILGAEHYSEKLIDLISYSSDASDHSHRPDCAVWPSSTEQVSQVMQLAGSQGVPVTPRGAGTGLAGGAIPAHGGIVMDLGRMNRIKAVRIPDRQAIVEPGVVYAELSKRLDEHGFCFPPDPASSKACTLGGNVATNAGGIRGAKYGVTRDYVLGLEVVLASGEIMHTGTKCIKSSSGLDLTRLFVGSEGVLGVITEIILKIAPKPLAFHTAMALFPSLSAAGEAVAAIMQSGVVPSVLEIMDSNTLRVMREHGGADLPRAEACILLETDGFTEAEAGKQMEQAVGAMQECGASKVDISTSPDEAAKLWKVRKAISSTAASLRPNAVSEDITVPISMVPRALKRAAAIISSHNLPFVIFGHAGDGNLHPKMMYDPNDADQSRHVKKAVDEIFAMTCQLEGTLSGEHGIGLAKAPYMHLEHDQASLNLMRGIKRLVDPGNILNPGKLALGD
jgi:glycolate oxidase